MICQFLLAFIWPVYYLTNASEQCNVFQLWAQSCDFLNYYFLLYRLYTDTTLNVSSSAMEWEDLACFIYNIYGKWHMLVQVLLWYFLKRVTLQQEIVTGVWLQIFKRFCHSFPYTNIPPSEKICIYTTNIISTIHLTKHNI